MPDINLLALEINRALSLLQFATGNQKFTWQNVDYLCVPHTQTAHTLFGAGGLTSDYALELDVNHDVLPTPGPKPPQFITFAEKKYRIAKVVKNPDLSLRISCVDPDRGAGILEREM